MALYVVATPIGNLKDITLRALEVLRAVDCIVAEDTRVTKKLLSRYEISKPVLSFHAHSGKGAIGKIIALLEDGKDVACVVDAGTPSVSDPGSFLIREIVRILPDVSIIPIPGPSALTAALSVAGITDSAFLFLGFPPAKKGRQSFFKEVVASKYPVVLYESPHRIKRTLEDLCEVGLSRFEALLIKEISKVYETQLRMSIDDIRKKIFEEKNVRGEFVLVINKNLPKQ